MAFVSKFRRAGNIQFPTERNHCRRVQLMPIVLHDTTSLPDDMDMWRDFYASLCLFVSSVDGVGYLTIDRKFVEKGHTHRRPGLHVDGMGDWGGGGGGWGGSDGMLIASDVAASAAWQQEFDGIPLAGTDPGDPDEGNCEHLRLQCLADCRTVLMGGSVYWAGSMCVHESLPLLDSQYRTFVRLSLPSSYGSWPSNCTPNPKVKSLSRVCEPRRVTGQYAYGN